MCVCELSAAFINNPLFHFLPFFFHLYRLEPRLYKFCHKDATKFCGAPKDWYDTETRTQSDDAPLVLSCLHARMKHPEKEVRFRGMGTDVE